MHDTKDNVGESRHVNLTPHVAQDNKGRFGIWAGCMFTFVGSAHNLLLFATCPPQLLQQPYERWIYLV